MNKLPPAGLPDPEAPSAAATLAEKTTLDGDIFEIKLLSPHQQLRKYVGRAAVGFGAVAPGFPNTTADLLWATAAFSSAILADVPSRRSKQTKLRESHDLLCEVRHASGQGLDVIKNTKGNLQLVWLGRGNNEIRVPTDIKRIVEVAREIGATEIAAPADIARATNAPSQEEVSFREYFKRAKGYNIFSKDCPLDAVAIIQSEVFDEWVAKNPGTRITEFDKALRELKIYEPKSRVHLAAKRGPRAAKIAAGQSIAGFIEADSAMTPVSDHNPTLIKQDLRYEVINGHLVSRFTKTGKLHESVPLARLARNVQTKVAKGIATEDDYVLKAYIRVYEAASRPKTVAVEDTLLPPSSTSVEAISESFAKQQRNRKRQAIACTVAAVAIGWGGAVSFMDTDAHEAIFERGPLYELSEKVPQPPAERDVQQQPVDKSPAAPDWIIHSYAKMSPYGYWADNVSDTLRFGRPAMLQESQVAFTQPLPEKHGKTASLEVERTFELSDAMIKKGDKYRIPILLGTRVTAASFSLPGSDGKSSSMPAELLGYSDGTSQLRATGSLKTKQLTLRYWLEDGGKWDPRAINSMQVQSDEDKPHAVNRKAVLKMWNAFHMKYPDAIAKFNYDLHAEEARRAYTSEASFVADVLFRRAANCETTAMLKAVTEPNRLNIASGYINSGGNEADQNDTVSYLSVHEKHAWTIDGDGTVEDDTPTSMTPEMQKKFKAWTSEKGEDFNPNYVSDEMSPLARLWRDHKLPAAGLLAVAGLFAPRLTRRTGAILHRKSIEASARYYQRRSQKLSAEDTGLAYEVIQQVLFDPHRKKSITTPKKPYSLDGSQAIKNLSERIDARSDYTHLLRHLKQHTELSRQEYKSLRTLLRAVKTRQQKAALYD